MADQDLTLHLTEAHCADIVLATLAGPELDTALAHARACPACEERLRLHAAAHARASAAASARLLAAPAPRKVLPLPLRAGLLIAAAAVLVMVVALPRLLPGPPREPQRWLPAPDAGISLREGETDPHLEAGLAAYAQRDLGVARRELEAAKVTGGAETARRLYLANTLLALDEPEGALTLLRGIDLLNVPEPWQEEALWALQLAYRRTGQELRADSLQRAAQARPIHTP